LFALVLIVALPFVIAPVEKWIEQRDYGLADYCEDGVFCMALDLDDDRRLAANADLYGGLVLRNMTAENHGRIMAYDGLSVNPPPLVCE